MLLEKEMDLVPVMDAAFALLQVVYPVAASVLDMCWQALVYNSLVDLSS
jgi:hypothetical protein